jgi:PhzF family phenazine biosynthesis protein
MSPAVVRPYRVVDVFTDRLTAGNPLAVVHDADGLDDATMAAFARWTNLSETAFLLTPTDPAADYRVRIFTPGGELPFAGHPTIGSAWAWLAAGGQPRHGDAPVQQCGIGRVPLRRTGGRLAFAAPPLRREPVDPGLLARVLAALGLAASDVLDSTWLDNGPRWLALRLAHADQVRALAPDHAALASLAKVGVVAPQAPGADTQVEVRAFAAPIGVPEDPVTGSLNAGLAAWLIGGGHLPRQYVAAQGGALGRAGRVHLHDDGATLWVGGDVADGVQGTLRL